MEKKNQSNSLSTKLASERKRHYYYDYQSSKHYLLNEDGSKILINKTGLFPTKFRKNLTGFKTHKQRKIQSIIDEGALHFVPQTTFKRKQNQFYTPQLEKYAGYAQSPYVLKGNSIPQYLVRPKTCELMRKQDNKKSYVYEKESQNKLMKSKHQRMKSEKTTLIQTMQKSLTCDNYFQSSLNSIINSHPLPRFGKKTCYNNKCMKLRNFTSICQKEKNNKLNRKTNTLGKSFFQTKFNTQKKQAILHEKMR